MTLERSAAALDAASGGTSPRGVDRMPKSVVVTSAGVERTSSTGTDGAASTGCTGDGAPCAAITPARVRSSTIAGESAGCQAVWAMTSAIALRTSASRSVVVSVTRRSATGASSRSLRARTAARRIRGLRSLRSRRILRSDALAERRHKMSKMITPRSATPPASRYRTVVVITLLDPHEIHSGEGSPELLERSRAPYTTTIARRKGLRGI